MLAEPDDLFAERCGDCGALPAGAALCCAVVAAAAASPWRFTLASHTQSARNKPESNRVESSQVNVRVRLRLRLRLRRHRAVRCNVCAAN